MRAVGVKELRDHLSEYVRLAHGGEVVLVTDRDRVVAELVAPRADRASSVSDARMAELLRTGLARPPLCLPEGAPPRLRIAPTASLLSELEEDREDR